MIDPAIYAEQLIARFEGCRLTAYQDCRGIWTIGYGETLHVTKGMVWTLEQANTQLTSRVRYFLNSVLLSCPQLMQESTARIAACTSLAYNIGIGAFSVSSVCRKTKRKDYAGAAAAFMLWNKAGGKPVLTSRRLQESSIYLQS